MTEINIPLGKFSIVFDSFQGYQAPDESVKRPVPESEEEELYRRKKTGWQPVQVEIPKGLHSIGPGAFEACYGITAVTIPDTITLIGSVAFRGCISLTRVTLPDSVKRIWSGAFRDCTALKEITIPNGVAEIKDKAFAGCTALTRICVPDSVQTIGDAVFAGCTGLQEITLPDALCGQAKRIFGDLEWASWRWFDGKLQVNPALAKALRTDLKRRRRDITENLIASEDGETLDRYLALWDKVPLDFLDGLIETSVNTKKAGITALLMQYKSRQYTQAGIEMAQQRRMERELGLRSRTVAEWHKIFIFHKEDGEIVITGYKGADDVVEVPAVIGNSPVTVIAQWVPWGGSDSNQQYTVILPEGVREIREGAFQYSNLKEIHLPNTLTRIGRCAFASCGKLRSISLPSSVTKIEDQAFEYCEKLEHVSIPSGVTRIEYGTFSYCDALQSVTLPDSISYVNISAFVSCPKLLRLVLPAGVQKVSGSTWDWNYRKIEAVAPKGSITEQTLKKAGIRYSLC